MPQVIQGHAAAALKSLSQEQITFIESLPKAELHAHLNGSIPLACLQELAKEFMAQKDVLQSSSVAIQESVQKLQDGIELNVIDDFFGLFPAIYLLTSTPAALTKVTEAVLDEFLGGQSPQCSFLELRSTPKATDFMTRLEYVQIVLEVLERYPADKAAFIVSLDRRMAYDVAAECVDIAIILKQQGRRVVGIDLCGDPTAGDMAQFAEHFAKAKSAGLGITLHIAETSRNTSADTMQLLSFRPDRLGHATFLDEDAKKYVFENQICIEMCLTSNLLCKTVASLADHHIRYHLTQNHPMAICTDDALPFRTSMLGEYALLMAVPPLGLGLKNEEVEKLAAMSCENRLGTRVVPSRHATEP